MTSFPGRSASAIVVCALLLLCGVHAAPADPASETIQVTAAPIGRFGFGTGSGGMLWNPTIGHLVINQIQAGGPAEKAGLRLGDEILAVDGLTVSGRSRSEVFKTMRNKDAGKPVTFKVASDKGKGPAHEVRVVPVDTYKPRR